MYGIIWSYVGSTFTENPRRYKTLEDAEKALVDLERSYPYKIFRLVKII